MHVLVTGITGFVGGHLSEHLLARGDEVTGCSRRGVWPRELEHLAARTRLDACDLAEPRAVKRLLESTECDAVVHLAGLADPRACKADSARAARDNVTATRLVIDAIRSIPASAGRSRPRLLMVSTAYVYGTPATVDLPLSESAPHRATHEYATTKLAAEHLAEHRAAKFGLDIIRVRPFNHAGPRQSAGYIVPDWARQIAAIEAGRSPPRLRVGNLDSRRDYTDVRDVVRAYRLLIEIAALSRGASGCVFNLGSGVGVSGREILERFQTLSRVPFEFEVDPALVRPDEPPEIVADATALRQFTGWRPEIDLETTLGDTLDWWRSQL